MVLQVIKLTVKDMEGKEKEIRVLAKSHAILSKNVNLIIEKEIDNLQKEKIIDSVVEEALNRIFGEEVEWQIV